MKQTRQSRLYSSSTSRKHTRSLDNPRHVQHIVFRVRHAYTLWRVVLQLCELTHETAHDLRSKRLFKRSVSLSIPILSLITICAPFRCILYAVRGGGGNVEDDERKVVATVRDVVVERRPRTWLKLNERRLLEDTRVLMIGKQLMPKQIKSTFGNSPLFALNHHLVTISSES